VGGQRHAPATLTPGKTRYPLCRRLGGLQGRSGRVRKISPPKGFDPRTVQPMASRYINRATPGPVQTGLKQLFIEFRTHFLSVSEIRSRTAFCLSLTLSTWSPLTKVIHNKSMTKHTVPPWISKICRQYKSIYHTYISYTCPFMIDKTYFKQCFRGTHKTRYGYPEQHQGITRLQKISSATKISSAMTPFFGLPKAITNLKRI
jgi:hypothetical protein